MTTEEAAKGPQMAGFSQFGLCLWAPVCRQLVNRTMNGDLRAERLPFRLVQRYFAPDAQRDQLIFVVADERELMI